MTVTQASLQYWIARIVSFGHTGGLYTQHRKLYFRRPELWEFIRSSSYAREVQFLSHLLKKYHKQKTRVLDIGCGTGTMCHLLSRYGYTPYGLDINKEMVSYATKHYPEIPFYTGDMRSFSIPHTVDVIISFCATFSYNVTNDDIALSLSRFAKHLSPGGIVVLDTYNPYRMIASHNGKIRYDRYAFGGNTYVRRIQYHIDAAREQLFEQSTWTYNLRTFAQEVTRFRLIFPQEMVLFFQHAGFRVLGFYGDLKLSAMDNFSLDHMIVVAELLRKKQ